MLVCTRAWDRRTQEFGTQQWQQGMMSFCRVVVSGVGCRGVRGVHGVRGVRGLRVRARVCVC